MILIPGVESAPFYYWHGMPFSGKFEMLGWHQHLLALGIDKAETLEYLPIIGNDKGLRKGWDIVSLWPFILLAVGMIFSRRHKMFALAIVSIAVYFYK